MNEYFTQLKILWDEMMMLKPLPQCTCEPQCDCGALQTMKEHVKAEYVIRFFKG